MKYDPNEYQLISEIRTTAELSVNKCKNKDEAAQSAETLYEQTLSLMNYSQFLPHDEPVQKATVELNKMAKGLIDQYDNNKNISEVFCKIKFQNIENSAKTMQKVIGAKPR